jgi:hypothetical protein
LRLPRLYLHQALETRHRLALCGGDRLAMAEHGDGSSAPEAARSSDSWEGERRGRTTLWAFSREWAPAIVSPAVARVAASAVPSRVTTSVGPMRVRTKCPSGMRPLSFQKISGVPPRRGFWELSSHLSGDPEKTAISCILNSRKRNQRSVDSPLPTARSYTVRTVSASDGLDIVI